MARRSSVRGSGTLLLTAALLTALLITACKPPGDDASSQTGAADGVYVVSLSPLGDIGVDGFAVDVTVTKDGAPVAGAAVTIVGEMTHAGMPRLEWEASEVEPGRYRLESFTPTMPGDWVITAEVVPPGAAKVTHELFLTLSR